MTASTSPALRSPLGATVILTAVLYPYVYVLGRSAFLGQSRQALEAARCLGQSYGQAVRRVAVPLARPALAAGASLAVMEALADFGTVDLLGIQALTSVIYRVWYGTFDQDSALQLATVLVGLALMLVTFERALRGRARYHQALGRGDAIAPRPLRGARRWLAPLSGVLLLLVAFALPVAQLCAWALATISEDTLDPNLTRAVRNTVVLGGLAALSRSSPRRPSRSVSVPTARASGRRAPAWRRSATRSPAPWSPSPCTCLWLASTGEPPTGPRTCSASTPG